MKEPNLIRFKSECVPEFHHKEIANEKSRGSKTEITIRDDPFDKRKYSVHADEVVHNEPGESLIVSDQDSDKNTHNSSNNIVYFGDSIPKYKYYPQI